MLDHLINADEAWLRMLQRLISSGRRVRPRGELTLELVADTVACRLDRSVVTLPSRSLGYRFLAHHTAWLLSGSDRVMDAPREVARYSDDGLTLFGAYGPRLRAQLPYVVESLTRDEGTRQAVINLWRESPRLSRDVPCTLSVQHLIRDSFLHLIVTMRSSDAWLGLPNDLAGWGAWACYVALHLRDLDVEVKLGVLWNAAGSRHLYEKNLTAARTAVDAWAKGQRALTPLDPAAFSSPGVFLDHLWALSRREVCSELVIGGWLFETFDW